MEASTASTDSNTERDPAKTLDVSDRVTFLPNHTGKVSPFSVQTFNGSKTMNSHISGSAAPLEGRTVTSDTSNSSSSSTVISVTAVNSGPVLSKGLSGATMLTSSNSVIQAPLMNSESPAAAAPQPVSQAPGPTVTLIRPPVGSGSTLNGNNTASAAAPASTTNQTGIGVQTPPVNNGQPCSSVSVSADAHIIKAEPPTTIIQSTPQPAGTPGAVGAPHPPAVPVACTGGIRPLTPQILAPRLPQTPTGQPSVHNIQLPPGE